MIDAGEDHGIYRHDRNTQKHKGDKRRIIKACKSHREYRRQYDGDDKNDICKNELYPTFSYAEGFFFVFSRSVFGFRGFESFRFNNGLFLKNEFFKISWVRILSKKGWTDFVVVGL